MTISESVAAFIAGQRELPDRLEHFAETEDYRRLQAAVGSMSAGDPEGRTVTLTNRAPCGTETSSMKPTPPDPRSRQHVWNEQYQLLKGNPMPWLLKAWSLIDAFEVLIADDERKEGTGEPRRVQGVAYMLAGFAIENLLKGQLVARQAASERAGRFKFNSHDLRQLAQDAGYNVTDDENRLLERVQQFAVWTGRYPIPMEPDDMRPRATPDGGFAPRTFHQLGEDWPAIRELVARFAADLRKLC